VNHSGLTLRIETDADEEIAAAAEAATSAAASASRRTTAVYDAAAIRITS